MPITVGVAVNNGAIERVKVLVYRESRGWEVKSPAFTAQFSGAKLDSEKRLDKQIDGISGATLSVRALSRLTRLALLFDRQTSKGGKP
jgi:Na+-translocating ferredoxin:NAD+ oxidoreductase RnfG subunit